MTITIENTLEILSFIGSLLLILYLVSNYMFNISAHEKLIKVRGQGIKDVNISLLTIIIMYLAGMFIGYLLEFYNIYVSLLVSAPLLLYSIYIRNGKQCRYLGGNISTQLFVYYALPILVGILSGGICHNAVSMIEKSAINAVVDIICILIMLFSLILSEGRYRYINFASNINIDVSFNDEIWSGTLVAETDAEIIIENDGKVIRLFKSEIKFIKQN